MLDQTQRASERARFAGLKQGEGRSAAHNAATCHALHKASTWPPPHPDVLTPAEWRVANAVRHGMTNREISRRLGVSADAVEYHGGTRLFLTSRKDEGSAGQSTLYFSTPNIAAAYEQVVARGVNFRGTPHLIHCHDSGVEEWMTFFEDPDGQLLALMSQVTR